MFISLVAVVESELITSEISKLYLLCPDKYSEAFSYEKLFFGLTKTFVNKILVESIGKYVLASISVISEIAFLYSPRPFYVLRLDAFTIACGIKWTG